jgi:hypothetical protein
MSSHTDCIKRETKKDEKREGVGVVGGRYESERGRLSESRSCGVSRSSAGWCGKGPGQIKGALLLHGTEAADGRVSARLRRHKRVTLCARWMLTGDNLCVRARSGVCEL